MNKIINIFMCVRNNGNTLENTLFLLNQIETENKQNEFRYYIYENDSTDNTKNIILTFFKNHKGNCIFESLNNTLWGNIKDEKRVFDMSIYRNKMKHLCKNYNNSEYSIILDTNITFKTTIFRDMIHIFDKYDNIQMITPYGCVEGKPNLYYDTFALDIESNFKGNKLKQLKYEMKKKQLVNLKSGFAGFIMIKTLTLKSCSWKSSCKCSEHNHFCKEVLEFGDIVCATHIKVYWKK